jgi:hypothetical protein
MVDSFFIDMKITYVLLFLGWSGLAKEIIFKYPTPKWKILATTNPKLGGSQILWVGVRKEYSKLMNRVLAYSQTIFGPGTTGSNTISNKHIKCAKVRMTWLVCNAISEEYCFIPTLYTMLKTNKSKIIIIRKHRSPAGFWPMFDLKWRSNIMTDWRKMCHNDDS